MTTTTNLLSAVPVCFDRDSRDYGARELIGPTAKYRRIWKTRFEPLQQSEGDLSVGFAGASLLSTAPIRHIVSNESARILNAHSGSGSVLELMKACKKLGFFDRYVWNFGLDDTIDWIVRQGPVILGVNWYESMLRPEDNGFLDVMGEVVGRHAIMANGYWPNHSKFGDVLVVTNSWGTDWGYRGVGFIPLSGVDRLLSENGESTGAFEIHPRRVESRR